MNDKTKQKAATPAADCPDFAAIDTLEKLVALCGPHHHAAVKQRLQFLTQPGGYQDIILDGSIVGEIENGKITDGDCDDYPEKLQLALDATMPATYADSSQACRAFMAAVIWFAA